MDDDSDMPWWAQSISVRRQEFDAFGTLSEVVAVQRVLDTLPPGVLTRDNFTQKYAQALLKVREAKPGLAGLQVGGASGGVLEPAEASADDLKLDVPGAPDMQDATTNLAAFGAEASGLARRASAFRQVLTFICPDRRGVVGAAARVVAAHGGNIERASMTLIAGQAVTSLLVGTPSAAESSSLRESAESALEDYGGPPPISKLLRPTEVGYSIHRPGRYALTARFAGELSLANAVTQALAALDIPLTELSFALQQRDEAPERIQTLEARFAVADRRLPGGSSDVVRMVTQAVKHLLPEAHVSVDRAQTWGSGSPQAHRPSLREDDGVLVTLGRGRPGFVHRVIELLTDEGTFPLDVRALSVVVLEDICVVTSVVARRSLLRLGSTHAQVESRICSGLAQTHGSAVVRVDVGARPQPGDERLFPTHELTLAVREQPGVIAELCDELLSFGVNVYWLSSAVLKPRFGEAGPRCVVAMQLQVSPESESDLDSRLRTLATATGWEAVSFKPWSISGTPSAGRSTRDERTQRVLEATVASLATLEESMRPPRLLGFAGYVGAEIRGGDTPTPAPRYHLDVIIGRERTNKAHERVINIASSETAEWVPFEIVVDSDTLDVMPPSLTVMVGESAPAYAMFELALPDVPETHRVTVQVRQFNRVIQFVSLDVASNGSTAT